jgi:hypothetical protein
MTLIEPLEPNMGYMSGYKYQLFTTVRFRIPSLAAYSGYVGDYISIEEGGILVLQKGYASDGASGPTLDTPSTMRGAFVHDALYQLIRLGVLPPSYKETADSILKELCVIDHMWAPRAWFWDTMLGKFGLSNTLPSHRRTVKYAP